MDYPAAEAEMQATDRLRLGLGGKGISTGRRGEAIQFADGLWDIGWDVHPI